MMSASLRTRIIKWINTLGTFKMHLAVEKRKRDPRLYLTNSKCKMGALSKSYVDLKKKLGITKRTYVKRKIRKVKKMHHKEDPDDTIYKDTIDDTCLSVKDGKVKVRFD